MYQIDQSSKADTSAVTPFPANISLAIAYVPMQKFDQMFSPEAGFEKGTIFPELYKPFLAKGGKC